MSEKLAPQPGTPTSTTKPQQDAGDALLIFILSLGKFFSSICRINYLSYFFWTGFFYFVGATVLLVALKHLAPQVGGKCACPAKQNGYLLVGLWYTMGIINVLTAYAYTSVINLSEEDFENVSGYLKATGFFTKVVPSYSRLVHIFNFCQLDIMAIQILFLPECNGVGFITSFGVVVLLWWAVIVFGVWCKRRIFVPPFIYEPLKPATSFAVEIEKLMRSFGP